MTVNEVLKNYDLTTIDCIELWKAINKGDLNARIFHGDYIESINDGAESDVTNGIHNLTQEQLNMNVVTEILMDCDEYNHSVLLNTSITTDDYGWENEKILCILVEEYGSYNL